LLPPRRVARASPRFASKRTVKKETGFEHQPKHLNRWKEKIRRCQTGSARNCHRKKKLGKKMSRKKMSGGFKRGIDKGPAHPTKKPHESDYYTKKEKPKKFRPSAESQWGGRAKADYKKIKRGSVGTSMDFHGRLKAGQKEKRQSRFTSTRSDGKQQIFSIDHQTHRNVTRELFSQPRK